MQPNITTLFMLGYAIAAPNLQNYGFQGRRGLDRHNETYKNLVCSERFIASSELSGLNS
ncbi:hypothetical protein [Nostoc sp. C110]|uniref:hypothetical protein n=1 Tax=Nostoc sp. C110 TaxID=3349876 RepID=UPI00370D4C5E